MSQVPTPQSEPPQPQGISLDELTEAFAKAMGAEAKIESGIEPAEHAEHETTDAVAEEPAGRQTEHGPATADQYDEACQLSPRSILEAMLFVGNRDGQPLAAQRAAELMRDVEPAEIPALVEQLNERYAAGGCPYHITNDGAGYRLTLRKAFHPIRNRFYGRIREARLSQAAVDVLAIVAYQQPLTGEQISHLRGKPNSHVLAQLVRRGLLRIERLDPKRRTASYFTTDRFLALFGMESLDDLPQSEELDRP